MEISFDTCILVDVLRERRADFRSAIRVLVERGEELHLSAIAHHELYFGALRTVRPAEQLRRLDLVVAPFSIADWTRDDAMASAGIRAELEGLGSRIGGFDVLIAGQALARGWAIATTNLRDFSRIPGLTVIDWTPPVA